jgi:hypothetical protein
MGVNIMDTKEEFDLIAKMLQIAFDNKLEVEIVMEFYQVVKNNPNASLEELVFMALGAWDCNSIDDEYKALYFLGDDNELS